jgi:hypothetical protein
MVVVSCDEGGRIDEDSTVDDGGAGSSDGVARDDAMLQL